MSTNDEHLDLRGEYLDSEETLGRLVEAMAEGEQPDGADRKLAAMLSLAAAEESLEEHPAEMLAELRRRKDRERGLAHLLRSRPTPQRVGIAAAGVALVGGYFALFRARPDWAEYPEGRMWIAAGLFGGLAVASLGRSLRPMHRPLPTWAGLVAAGLVAAFVMAGAPAAHTNHHASIGGVGPELLPAAVKCLVVGLASGLPVFLLARWLDRGAHNALSRVLLAAGAAGLAGNLVLQMSCPMTSPAHLLLGHATTGVLLLLAAFGLRGGR